MGPEAIELLSFKEVSLTQTRLQFKAHDGRACPFQHFADTFCVVYRLSFSFIIISSIVATCTKQFPPLKSELQS